VVLARATFGEEGLAQGADEPPLIHGTLLGFPPCTQATTPPPPPPSKRRWTTLLVGEAAPPAQTCRRFGYNTPWSLGPTAHLRPPLHPPQLLQKAVLGSQLSDFTRKHASIGDVVRDGAGI
jgi:hypothetical protein